MRQELLADWRKDGASPPSKAVMDTMEDPEGMAGADDWLFDNMTLKFTTQSPDFLWRIGRKKRRTTDKFQDLQS